MLAIVAPGQGSQKPGMLAPWLEVPGLTELATEFGEAAVLDLLRLGTSADADEIKDTAVTQPLVVASALLAAAALTLPPGARMLPPGARMLPPGEMSLPPGAVAAGHSVGELAAAAIAGVLQPVAAVHIAALRGSAMGQACAAASTGMSAVLGGDTESVLAALAELELVGANVNGGGQIVAAGATDALSRLAGNPPPGSRIIPLPVAGAFHTHYMATAEEALGTVLEQLPTQDPNRLLLTNSDGSVVTSGSRYLALLVAQVTRPVRWDRCMATLSELGVTGVLELPPAGTLVGLVKRDLKGVATLPLRTPDDLDKAAAFIGEHSTFANEHSAVTFANEHSAVDEHTASVNEHSSVSNLNSEG